MEEVPSAEFITYLQGAPLPPIIENPAMQGQTLAAVLGESENLKILQKICHVGGSFVAHLMLRETVKLFGQRAADGHVQTPGGLYLKIAKKGQFLTVVEKNMIFK